MPSLELAAQAVVYVPELLAGIGAFGHTLDKRPEAVPAVDPTEDPAKPFGQGVQ